MAALAVRATAREAPFASGGSWAAGPLEPTPAQRHRDKPTPVGAAVSSNLLRRRRLLERAPPKAASAFKKAYDEGLLPLRFCYDRATGASGRQINGRSIGWVVPDALALDFDHYAHLFCEGLAETGEPLGFLAAEGLHELLWIGYHGVDINRRGRGTIAIDYGENVASTAQLYGVAKRALTAVAAYARCDARERGGLGVCGRALPLESLAPAVDAARRRFPALRFDAADVLGTLERHGGPEALQRIKRGVLAYESVL